MAKTIMQDKTMLFLVLVVAFFVGGPPVFTVITLDGGTGSSDPDGDPITFSWVQTSGTPVTLSDDTNPLPTFTAPLLLDDDPVGAGPEDDEVLTFELTVTDNRGLVSIPDSVTITITFVD